MVDFEVTLIGAIVTAIVAILTFGLNEWAKRRTALADRLWEIKNENLCKINNILYDLKNLADHFHGVSRVYETHFSDTFSRLTSLLVVSYDISSRFMDCKYYLLDKDPTTLDRNDQKTYEAAKAELSSILLGLLFERRQALYEPLSKVELIIIDNEVIYTVFGAMAIVQEISLQFEKTDEEFEAQLKMLDELILRFKNLSRGELERTRTSRASAY